MLLCVAVLSSFLVYCWKWLHCIYNNLFIPSFVDGHLGYFHLSSIVNSAAMNVHVHMLVEESIFISFRYTPRSGTVEPHGNSIFNLLGKPQNCFPQWLDHFTLLPIMCKNFQFLHILTSTCYVPLLFFLFLFLLLLLPSWMACEVVLHYSFYLHFLNS